RPDRGGPGPDADVLARDAARIRAESEEGDLGEGDVAGVAREEVPRRREGGVHQREDADVDDPRGVDDEREADADRGERRSAEEPRGSRPSQSIRSRRPKMPCGRTSRKTISTTKYEKAAQVGAHSTAT